MKSHVLVEGLGSEEPTEFVKLVVRVWCRVLGWERGSKVGAERI